MQDFSGKDAIKNLEMGSEREMVLDLSSIEVFEEDQIDFDKRVTFIFGKNGTGKTTIAEEMKKLTPGYDVMTFQGFANIIDENKRLNAVVLGEENATISKQIEVKKAELEAKLSEVDRINKTLKNPEDDSISNFWTKRAKAEQDYKVQEKKLDDFYSQSASKIKKIDKPRISSTSYNKRNFQDDISGAVLLSDGEIKQLTATILSEAKVAPEIVFPKIDFQTLVVGVQSILKKTVIERVKISRLENNTEKREFAKTGLQIHKKGDVCAFCGSPIPDATWDELVGYFSADEVKNFQIEIQNKMGEIDVLIDQLNAIKIDANYFYPSFSNEVKSLSEQLEEEKKAITTYLTSIRKILDEKLKYLFEELSDTVDVFSDSLENIETRYKELVKENNENDLATKKQDAVDKLRKHYVKKFANEFGYDAEIVTLNTLAASKQLRETEYDSENEKVTGTGGLNEIIRGIQDEITTLQNGTKNEMLLAENINRKLKHMVSFELVHVEDDESHGFYRVKNSATGCERDITELSTGEKNVIAFLYFIEKIDEVKDIPSIMPRVIVFDDPMSSNDDGMQYLIIEELQKLLKRLSDTDHFILLTHNKHFYLNVKYGRDYKKDRFIRFQSDGSKTHFVIIDKENDDYKTSYESLWNELKLLYGMETVSADLLLNPIRRIIETYTKFNVINKGTFCSTVDGAMKLFNVNSHSIDDVEAELNGKTKSEVIQMFYDCFAYNNKEDHFMSFWGELVTDESGNIVF